MKKVIISLSIIAVVAAIVIGATGAFFSDTETSTGNTFTAGAIDLKIDNDSWYFGSSESLEKREDLSWTLDDLTGHLFFSYSDLKPGDWGEDTISIHVSSNDAWACTDLYLTKNDDMSSSEPELDAGDALENPENIFDGELADEVQFFFWIDDGDNVFENGEEMLIAGPASAAIDGLSYALADSVENNVGDEDGDPLEGGKTYYIGKIWCFGNLEVLPEEGEGGPDVRHAGITCNGAEVGNMSQTDNMMVDLSFTAYQARHNGDFICSPQGETPVMKTQSLENKDNGWDVIDDDTFGNIVYSDGAQTFNGTVVGQGLVPNAYYQITLNGPGVCSDTDNMLANFGANLFESGYWNDWAPNLSTTCTGDPGQGIYNMNLIANQYTVETNASGEFNYSFNLTLPAGDYAGVKVLVKKTIEPYESPWIDSSTEHTTNLFETDSISFTVTP